MANPPFNVNNVHKERLKDDPRFPFGLPRADNANYLWIQVFYSALNERGRAGFVMANSAADARQSELEIRRQLIESRAVDVMIAVGSNFFLTVTLPCTLWFLDKGKAGTDREDKVLTEYPIALPPPTVLTQFSDVVDNIVAVIHNSIFRNQNLRQTRDLLLPRLVSGEVDVSELNIDTGGLGV